jgi:hypothetical protein
MENDNGRDRKAASPRDGDPTQQSGGAHARATGALATFLYPVAPPIAHKGIRAGEIIAWRLWRLAGNSFLASLSRDIIWVPGVPMTGDVRKKNGGVYSFIDSRDAWRWITFDSRLVVGRVAIWGEVITHERGYRSEFAKIIALEGIAQTSQALEIHDHPNEILAKLRSKYVRQT